MLTAVLRSICAGIAGVVLAFVVWVFGLLILAVLILRRAGPTDGGVVGIDLVTLVHNSPVSSKALALVAFVVGFALGYRYFARLAPHKQG
ncbi:MAG TPA: hypothetical protein VLY23_04355 [Candidatus Acidoferrum sp.]|nr:hypothetical protein [Candidatus Acidoferrum sp.]